MNLITGTSGEFGKAAASYYLENNATEKLAILSRSADKVNELTTKGAELRIGDYNDYQSLVAAFKGIDNLLLVSSNDLAHRATHHKNAIDAAKEAGVKHVIFTSFQYKSTAADSLNALMPVYLETENYLKNSGLTYTILRNGIYTDLLPGFIGDQIKENKTIFVPADETQAAFTSRNDLAEAAAIILKSGDFANSELNLTNTEKVNFKDIAGILSTVFDDEVKFVNPTAEVYNQVLTDAGLPAAVIGLLSGITASIKAGEFDKTTNDLQDILKRKPQSVAAFLTALYI